MQGLVGRVGLRPGSSVQGRAGVCANPAGLPVRTLCANRSSATGRNRQQRTTICTMGGAAPATTAEDEANRKRWEESGSSQGSVDEWRWTLNWDDITDSITVGSCPRSPGDIDRIVDEAGCDAILCLQCNDCHSALQIDWPVLRERAVAQGVMMTRVSVRDFDHNDQALMLPEAVRMLYTLLSMGRRVYVHCTAGINRATLTVVGYLTFVKGMDLDSAERLVKTQRSQAHPYIDCWRTVRTRLLEGRKEEIKAVARRLATEKDSNGSGNQDNFDNWVAAEEQLIREQFDRQVEASLTLLDSITDFHAGQFATAATLLSHQSSALRRRGSQRNTAEGEDDAGSLPPAPEDCVLEGCVLALEMAQEATSKVEQLKSAMSEVARAAEDALGSTPAPLNGTNSNNGNGAY